MSHNIRVGPVVGRVTEESARILLDTIEPVTLVLRNARDVAVTMFRYPRGVHCHEFLRLEPGVYSIMLDEGSGATPVEVGSFRCGTPRTLVAISCNNSAHEEQFSLYREASTADLAVHLGDQVYLDPYWDAARREPTLEGKKEQFRTAYRKAWSMPHVQYLLSHCSNLMILDDHEVHDGYGDRPIVPEEAELVHAARCVYEEYQASLHRPMHASGEGRAYFEHRADGNLFLFLDCRNERHKSTKHPFLSDEQAAWLQTTLAANRDVSHIYVCAPLPLVLLGAGTAQTVAEFVHPEFKGHWSADEYRSDQVFLLDLLREHPASFTVLGGDLHLGGMYDLFHDGTFMARQLLVGPVRGESNLGTMFKLLTEAENSASQGYSFEGSSFRGTPNVVRVDLENRMHEHVYRLKKGGTETTMPMPLTVALPKKGCCTIL